MRHLIVLLALVLSACAAREDSGPVEYPLTFDGPSATSFRDEGTFDLGGFRVVDSSSLLINGAIKTFFDWTDGADFASLRDGEVTHLPGGENFTYVFAHGSVLYKFGHSLSDIYLSRSEDEGQTWSRMNGGAPVLRHSADPASNFHYLWNPGVDIDDAGVWHMLIECSDEAPGQTHVGLCYLTGMLNGDAITFTPVTDAQVIAHGGNPFVKFLPGRGLLIVHGSVYGTSSFWSVTASTLVGGVFTEHADRFSVGTPGIHDCDPHMSERPEGGLLLTLSVDQSHVQSATSDQTFEEFFDSLTSN